jgi:hypothetical protein
MFTKQQPSNTDSKAQASLNQHVKEQTGHALDTAKYSGHGHAQGRQGATGHPMPPNPDAAKQDGAHVPQNMYSDGAGSASATDAASSNYGSVDNQND